MEQVPEFKEQYFGILEFSKITFHQKEQVQTKSLPR